MADDGAMGIAQKALKLVGSAAVDPIARSRPLPRVGFAGDSFHNFATNLNSAPVAKYFTNISSVNWTRWRFRDRMYTDLSLNTAVGGTMTDHLLNVQMPLLIANKARIVHVNCGTNDNGNLTVAQSVANLKAIFTLGAAYGMVFIWNTVIPQGTWSASRFRQMDEFNRQLLLASFNPAYNLIVADMTTMMDFTSVAAPYTSTALLVTDGVHPNIAGSMAQQANVDAIFDRLLPPVRSPLASSNDYFDAVLNPTGNILKNGGLLSGTAGTLVNGGTGTLATYWSGGFSTTGGSTMTVAFSKGVDSTYLNLPTQIITLGGTADSNGIRMEASDLNGNPLVFPAGIGAGDSLIAECSLSWTGLTNVKAVTLTATAVQNGSTYNRQDGSGGSVSGLTVGAMPTVSPYQMLMRTPELELLSGFTNVRLRLEISPLTTGQSIGGVVTIRGGMSFRKVGSGGL